MKEWRVLHSLSDIHEKAYAIAINKIPLLTPEHERELGLAMRAGDEQAGLLLILHSQRLVWSIVIRYRGLSVDLMDLVSECNLSLLKAINAYNPDLGRFSTWAGYWIKQSAQRGISKFGHTIHLPDYAAGNIYKVQRKVAAMRAELGREVSFEEAAEALGVPESTVAWMQRGRGHDISLDRTSRRDDEASYSSLTPDPDVTSDPAHVVIEADEERLLRQDLADAMYELTPQQLRVITLRYGLDGQGPRTLEEVGQEFGFTRERARQIEKVALGIMRGEPVIRRR